jgi:hypothetical protein
MKAQTINKGPRTQSFRKAFAALVLLFCGLGSWSAQKAAYPLSFDSSLLPSERKIILDDLQLCAKLKRDHFQSSPELARSKTFQALQKDPQGWLFERVKVLVGRLSTTGLPRASKNSIMRNLGAVLSARQSANPLKIYLAPLGHEVVVDSPRVAIVQYLKEPSEIRIDENQPATALVNRIFRLGLLFHDARHSDGSGAETGLPHRECPAQHALAGQKLCDRYVDASSGVHYFLGQALVESFQEQLGASEKKILLDWLSLQKSNIVGSEIYE